MEIRYLHWREGHMTGLTIMTRVGVMFSRLFKYTEQHTAGLKENIGPRTFKTPVLECHPIPYTSRYWTYPFSVLFWWVFIFHYYFFFSYLFCQLFKVTKSRKYIFKFILILSHRKRILCICGSYTQDCAILRKLRPMTVLFD